MANQQRKLKLLSEYEARNRTVFTGTPQTTIIIKGDGKVDFVCGKCSAVLISGGRAGQVQNIVLKCGTCESYNDTPVFPLPPHMVN